MSAKRRSEGRIPRLAHHEAASAAAAAGAPGYLADLNIFRVLFHHPALADHINRFLSYLLLDGVLDARLRELVIMRIGWRTGSVYEWVQHWRIAPSFGVSATDLAGVRDPGQHPGFGPGERAVLAATDEVLATGVIEPGTWEECRRELGSDEAMLELVTVIGTWAMISSMLRTLEVPIEDDLEPWPPDGRPPS